MYPFQLRGNQGVEHITIVDGNNSTTYTLSQEWTNFIAVHSTITVEFHNDDGRRDVWFQSEVTNEIILESRWSNWNCDIVNENFRCQLVREGQFAWNGVYTIDFISNISRDTS